jgi:uncharacterized protein (DUF2267 family)
MSQQNGTAELTGFYEHVLTHGKLRTPQHAERWTRATLRTLGLNLDRGTKKAMSNELPEKLAFQLNRSFWLLHFRNKQLSSHDFCQAVGRRSGNTDPDFARIPVQAVFGGLKQFLKEETQKRVANTLSPELSDLWQKA